MAQSALADGAGHLDEPVAELLAGLAAAGSHHEAGRLEQAEELYRRVLGVDPGNAEALDLMGVFGDSGGAALGMRQVVWKAGSLARRGAGGIVDGFAAEDG